MEKSIYAYILRYSKRQQIIVTLMAAVSFPFLYAFYELPKRIVNEAIQARNVTFPINFLGFELDQIPFLFVLCGIFLSLVFVNQSFKYVINVYRGLTGERMLRRLRFDLYGRVLRFPQPTFRKLSQGEIIQMINTEVEPLGGFVGDSFSLPAFQGGTLLVIFGFLLWQNVYLAAAAVAFYPLQFYFIPKLQRRVNALAKQRVRLVRSLSERIGETVTGVQEVHVNNTAALERADFSHRLGDIFETRFKIFLWKFVIKFINNSINHLGPFFFYSMGGYLVITGGLQLGTLVAVLAASKDLAAPWKELLAYYQRREDVRIKYEQVVEQFEPAGMMEAETQLAEPERIEPLTGEVAASGLLVQDETGHMLVDGATFSFDAAEHVAVVGAGGSGKDHVALLLARLMVADSGTLTIGGAKLAEMPEAVTGRRIGYVGPAAHMFSNTVRENLLYGLKRRPMVEVDYDSNSDKREARQHWLKEAEASGNSTDDLAADWVDYQAAGVADSEALNRRAIEVLTLVDMEQDIYELGLRGTIDPAARPDLAALFLEARVEFRKRLADPEIASLVETFDAELYNDNATVGENLLFGSPVGGAFDMDRLAENAYLLQVLEMAGLTDEMLEIGRQVATTMVELFADLPPGHEFFERFAFISHDDLPEYQVLLTHMGQRGATELSDEQRVMLLSLPFKLIPARHRLDVIDDEMKQKLLVARRLFAENLPDDLAGTVERFDAGQYNAAATLQDNILFGKLAYGQARGAERVTALVGEVVDNLGLRPAVMEVGLDFHAGIGGARLSQSQRQKLALARAVLKRPDILILNEATATLDSASQGRVMENLLNEFQRRGVVWALHRADLARRFDRVLVMQAGRVVEKGTFDDLDVSGSALNELILAE